ncbi:MAG: glycosyltransferase family 4 protein [Oculatellaceae cyanobacterium Prado106]|jgi:glycosyltransferase involved in cell wall biosynthesis|nr:glycosyltransferase family 4 protein [Oculatellaceae cyanobacterium Prado106]
MRIAQIAPLWERVPPPAYGGTELVVSLLTDGLVKLGHEVTLFATGDSITLAKLDAGSEVPLRQAGVTVADYPFYEALRLTPLFERADEFDVIHAHVDTFALPYGNFIKTPLVHTIHGIIPSLTAPLFKQHGNQNYVSISNSQRRNDLNLNYVGTVYNGINPDTYEFHAEPADPPYLAFFGRMSPEKGPQLAIELAKRTGWHLKMAGKVDPKDREFYEQEVEPLIDGEQIVYLGEANHSQKSEIMGRAHATLCMLTWEEPFGLVMTESMVCGTPVIAIARGAAPELIKDGETGFLCRDMEECVQAVSRIDQIDRRTCREHVVNNFSHDRMVEGYEAVYQRLLEGRFAKNGHLKKTAILAG